MYLLQQEEPEPVNNEHLKSHSAEELEEVKSYTDWEGSVQKLEAPLGKWI